MKTRAVALILVLLGAFSAGLFAGDPKDGKKAAGPARGAAKGPTAAGRKNLVPNGDFEAAGKGGPAAWQRPDGLTSFWVSAPGGKGKCIEIDTDVLASQFRAREDEMEKARAAGLQPPPPPKRLPTQPPKYDTVAGLDGVHFGSDEIPIDPAKHYLLEADVRVEGSASPKIWVKAYARTKSRDVERDRIVWKKSLNMNGAGPRWKTFRMVFPRGTVIPPGVDRIRLYLYPFWPPATYYYDNVKLVEISEEETKVFSEENDLLEGPPPPSKRGGEE
jgi:hypothetical protein